MAGGADLIFVSGINQGLAAASTGDISSDLYRPQSQDEIVQFSFFVADMRNLLHCTEALKM